MKDYGEQHDKPARTNQPGQKTSEPARLGKPDKGGAATSSGARRRQRKTITEAKTCGSRAKKRSDRQPNKGTSAGGRERLPAGMIQETNISADGIEGL
jgi:hypothetical protein